MSARVELQGFADLVSALRALPQELRDEAAPLVEATIETVATDLRRAYPEGDTGNLRKGVRTKIERGAFGVSGKVISASQHAHLWEFGTQSRVTRKGWRRGKSPHHRPEGLVMLAKRARLKLHAQLLDLVRRAGFEVTGSLDG